MNILRMKSHNESGKLITFCGLDGCGKSSMISMLADDLKEKGVEIILTKQPTNAMRNTDIFRTFMDEADNSAYEYRALSLMAAADRIQHVNKVILPALREGKTIICDRYFYSCLANLCARGYSDDAWIYEISESIIKPDLAFFLDLPVELAVSRVRLRPEEKDRYIDMPLQYRLKELYKTICTINEGELVKSDMDINDTYSTIKRKVYRLFDEYTLGGDNHDS